MSNDVVFGMRLTYEGREANVGLEQTRANVERLGAVSSKMASQYSGLNETVKQHNTEVKDTDASVRKLLDRYDQQGARLRQLQADFKALDAAASSGRIAGRDDARVDAVYVRLQKEIAAASSATAAFDGTSKSAALSAGQLRMATQQLPLQFQDIWVSLAAGQNPMMVLAQQGTQISGSFGGAGNAAKAMGGYVMGLINPLTLAASAAVAGGAAWYYWGREAESAADKAVAAADKIISGMRATDAVYVLQRERDKISKQIPMQWLSYDEKQLAKLDEDSQKLVAAYKKIDKQLKSETERSGREWEGLHATDAERKATALNREKVVYDEQVALAKGNSDKLIALETQHQQKIAAINAEYEKKAQKKPPRTEADKQISEYQQISEAGARRIAVLKAQADETDKLTESEKRLIEFDAVHHASKNKLIEQSRLATRAILEEAAALDKTAAANKASAAAWGESAKAIDKANTTSKEYLNQLQFETSLLGLSTLEVQKRTEARRIDLALEKELLALRSNDKLNKDPAALKAAEDGARQAAEAAKAGAATEIEARDRVTKSWEFGSREAIRKYDEQVRNSAAQSERLFSTAFKSAEDAITKAMMTGKLSVRDFANATIEEFYRIKVAQPMVSAGANFLGDLFGSMFGGGGGTTTYGTPATSSMPMDFGFPSATDSIINNVLSGGRASGGPVDPNSLYRVNELGPEMLNIDGNDYLMMGGRGGFVKPLSSPASVGAASAAPSLTVNVINAPAGTQVQQRQDGNGGMTLDVIIEQIEGGIARNVSRGTGALSGALTQTFGLNRAPGAY